MNYAKSNKILIDDVIYGLELMGYNEVGGSDVFRIMRRESDNACIKIFFNTYQGLNEDSIPIIVRYSYQGDEFNV